MPIYEYRCDKCGNVFEILVLGGDQSPPECEKCGSREVARRPCAAAAIGASAKSPDTSCAPNPSSGFS